MAQGLGRFLHGGKQMCEYENNQEVLVYYGSGYHGHGRIRKIADCEELVYLMNGDIRIIHKSKIEAYRSPAIQKGADQ